MLSSVGARARVERATFGWGTKNARGQMLECRLIIPRESNQFKCGEQGGPGAPSVSNGALRYAQCLYVYIHCNAEAGDPRPGRTPGGSLVADEIAAASAATLFYARTLGLVLRFYSRFQDDGQSPYSRAVIHEIDFDRDRLNKTGSSRGFVRRVSGHLKGIRKFSEQLTRR